MRLHADFAEIRSRMRYRAYRTVISARLCQNVPRPNTVTKTFAGDFHSRRNKSSTEETIFCQATPLIIGGSPRTLNHEASI